MLAIGGKNTSKKKHSILLVAFTLRIVAFFFKDVFFLFVFSFCTPSQNNSTFMVVSKKKKIVGNGFRFCLLLTFNFFFSPTVVLLHCFYCSSLKINQKKFFWCSCSPWLLSSNSSLRCPNVMTRRLQSNIHSKKNAITSADKVPTPKNLFDYRETECTTKTPPPSVRFVSKTDKHKTK